MEIIRQKLSVVEDLLSHCDNATRLATNARLDYELARMSANSPLRMRGADAEDTPLDAKRLNYEGIKKHKHDLVEIAKLITGAESITQLREKFLALSNLYNAYGSLSEQIVTMEVTIPAMLEILDGDGEDVERERENWEAKGIELEEKRRHKDILARQVEKLAERIQYNEVSNLVRPKLSLV
jgi:hypothetical protein